jgi:hypothetical protein
MQGLALPCRKISAVIRSLAMLNEDEDWPNEISIELDSEDGRLTVWDLAEDGTTASAPIISLSSPKSNL